MQDPDYAHEQALHRIGLMTQEMLSEPGFVDPNRMQDFLLDIHTIVSEALDV